MVTPISHKASEKVIPERSEVERLIDNAVGAQRAKHKEETDRRFDEIQSQINSKFDEMERSSVELSKSLGSMREDVHSIALSLREHHARADGDLKACASELKDKILKIVFDEFEKRDVRLVSELKWRDDKAEIEHGKLFKLARDNQAGVDKLMDGHRLAQRIQYAVITAVVLAVLKSTGVL